MNVIAGIFIPPLKSFVWSEAQIQVPADMGRTIKSLYQSFYDIASSPGIKALLVNVFLSAGPVVTLDITVQIVYTVVLNSAC